MPAIRVKQFDVGSTRSRALNGYKRKIKVQVLYTDAHCPNPDNAKQALSIVLSALNLWSTVNVPTCNAFTT